MFLITSYVCDNDYVDHFIKGVAHKISFVFFNSGGTKNNWHRNIWYRNCLPEAKISDRINKQTPALW